MGFATHTHTLYHLGLWQDRGCSCGKCRSRESSHWFVVFQVGCFGNLGRSWCTCFALRDRSSTEGQYPVPEVLGISVFLLGSCIASQHTRCWFELYIGKLRWKVSMYSIWLQAVSVCWNACWPYHYIKFLIWCHAVSDGFSSIHAHSFWASLLGILYKFHNLPSDASQFGISFLLFQFSCSSSTSNFTSV